MCQFLSSEHVLANISEGEISFDSIAIGFRTFSFLMSFKVPVSDHQSSH